MAINESNFNFEKIGAGRGGSAGSKLGTSLRVGNKALGFGPEVVGRWNTTRYKTKSGEAVRLSIQVDVVRRAILVKEDPMGFSFQVSDNGVAAGTMPAELRKLGLPRGDYPLVEGTHYIFLLAV